MLLLWVEVAVAAGAPATAPTLGPATIVTIIELQWTISLVESRTVHTRKTSGEAAVSFMMT
jgi:hypothetical protein